MSVLQWTAAIFGGILAVYGAVCVYTDIRWIYEEREIQKSLVKIMEELARERDR